MQKGKVVILGGTPRAGKTTLANMLTRSGFNLISFDSISQAIKDGLPEIKIEDWTDQEQCSKKLYPFFEALIKGYIGSEGQMFGLTGLNYVVDMYTFSPEYINKLPFQNEIKVYFLGYPNQSIEEIRHNIKFYAEPADWIAQVDEEYLTVVAQRCYFVNQKTWEQCQKYGYEFIDTDAGDNRNTILNDLFNKIITDLK